ncbi:hypothetical protein JL2886_00392 [Phaeobacter gallaeciensis]|uniref:Uncharacterized protein n=1 Tax=Phaeobacter gallaeciensis TaxID=60890 RepID=A0A1B0ZMK4_9RHOB|nr:hypothetical protein JL2886_00392 [Phaeobacter gallaeciensis]
MGNSLQAICNRFGLLSIGETPSGAFFVCNSTQERMQRVNQVSRMIDWCSELGWGTPGGQRELACGSRPKGYSEQ